MPSDAQGTPERHTPRWQRRRAEIVRAAESIFAAKGFAAARLEDVAIRIGVQRPSLMHYFQDKKELHDAVLAAIYASLLLEVEAAQTLTEPDKRLKALVDAWIRFLRKRPHAARVLLRQVADAGGPLDERSAELLRAIVRAFESIAGDGGPAARARAADAVHHSIMIAGMSLFMVSARHLTRQVWSFDPLSPENLQRHRDMLLHTTREFLAPARTTP